MRFKAILFDFGGVIVDNEIFLNQIPADELSEIGLPTTLEDSLRDHSGKRWTEILQIIETRLDQKIAWLSQKVLREFKPVSGIEAFVGITHALAGCRAFASCRCALYRR
jgi:beta-phosphoglucomutase-like phosphatase (HAD superfamily)